jgi:hypothetical protein
MIRAISTTNGSVYQGFGESNVGPGHTASAVSRPDSVATGNMTRLRKREVHYHPPTEQQTSKSQSYIYPPLLFAGHLASPCSKTNKKRDTSRRFATRPANQLTGLFPSDLWRRLVPQIYESYAPIRHAIIVIGALDPKIWRNPARSFEETARRQFAYHEYSMAISEMRSTMPR